MADPIVVSTECTWQDGDLHLEANIPTSVPQAALGAVLALSGVVLVTPATVDPAPVPEPDIPSDKE